MSVATSESLDVGEGRIIGAEVVVKTLIQQGVKLMFGVVGIPITPIAVACRRNGLKFIGMRNEQSASYAAGAAGYMTGVPAACLVVSGPGLIHGLAGVANAWVNNWPMVLISGCEDHNQTAMGAFQAGPQEKTITPFVKFEGKPETVDRIPYYVEKAVRTAVYGRAGPTYVSITSDIVTAQIDEEDLNYPPLHSPPPRSMADPKDVERAAGFLANAKNPLIIIGKGCAYARAENEAKEFVESTNIPFLPTPMGKGTIPDDHPLSIAPSRSLAIGQSDVIVLLGARLNWQMHYGIPPRFSEGVKFIQIDICPEELGNNKKAEVPLLGDLSLVIQQLSAAMKARHYQHPSDSSWRQALNTKFQKNIKNSQNRMNTDRNPMTYYRALRDVAAVIPRDAIVVSEGANSMDIGRTIIGNYEPRSRLDAGTWGTMGIGLGFAIAAAIVHPNKKIVAVEGDSAFGFSCAELEVACRFGLNICVIIINNNGVYRGLAELPENVFDAPPTALLPYAHYEQIADAFGGKGFYVDCHEDILATLQEAMALTIPTVVNIMVEPDSQRKTQNHSWLTTKKKKSKL